MPKAKNGTVPKTPRAVCARNTQSPKGGRVIARRTRVIEQANGSQIDAGGPEDREQPKDEIQQNAQPRTDGRQVPRGCPGLANGVGWGRCGVHGKAHAVRKKNCYPAFRRNHVGRPVHMKGLIRIASSHVRRQELSVRLESRRDYGSRGGWKMPEASIAGRSFVGSGTNLFESCEQCCSAQVSVEMGLDSLCGLRGTVIGEAGIAGAWEQFGPRQGRGGSFDS